jgi:hypothetical protein
MEQLIERLDANVKAFETEVSKATALKAQSDQLHKLTGPLMALDANTRALDDASALDLLTHLGPNAEASIALVLQARDLLDTLGVKVDRTTGDALRATLASAVDTFRNFGMADLPQIEQIDSLIGAWSESAPKVKASAGTRREKGEGQEITSHCLQAGCQWNAIDRTNSNSARWNAIGHWQTHHKGADKPARDSSSATSQGVWVSMTDALKLVTGGQSTAEAEKAAFRFDAGNTTSR